MEPTKPLSIIQYDTLLEKNFNVPKWKRQCAMKNFLDSNKQKL